MKKPDKTLGSEFFNKLYQDNEDPWNFENSAYEKEKYEATLDAIPKSMYERIFEIGCSNGLLSLSLADRCQNLLAVDASGIAVRNARKRLAHFPHVAVEEMSIPKDFPDMQFDLILLSEVGYFLSREDLIVSRDKMIQALLPGAHLLLIHWTPDVPEFPLTGDEVHEIFMQCTAGNASLLHLGGNRQEQYRLDLFEKKEFS